MFITIRLMLLMNQKVKVHNNKANVADESEGQGS